MPGAVSFGLVLRVVSSRHSAAAPAPAWRVTRDPGRPGHAAYDVEAAQVGHPLELLSQVVGPGLVVLDRARAPGASGWVRWRWCAAVGAGRGPCSRPRSLGPGLAGSLRSGEPGGAG